MLPTYVPINRAKKGEFDAYKSLSNTVKRSIFPIFELPSMSKTMLDSNKYSSIEDPIGFYIQNKSHEIYEAINDKLIGIDIHSWAPNSTIETGEHILAYYSSCLEELGCKAIPVVGYDRWEDEEYSTVLKQLSKSNDRFIIRLDEDAFQDMLEEDYFIENFEDIISSLNLDSKKSAVILDLGDVSKSTTTIITLHEKISTALKLLNEYDFSFISVAGCSVTGDINGMVSKINSQGIVVRKELKAWKSVKSFSPNINLVFGDYGVVNPSLGDDIIAPYANGKIRYTTEDSYFVVRGYPKNTLEKGAQMHELSRRLIASEYYNLPSFSWGDNMIKLCATEGVVEGKKTPFKGSSTDWVAIDSCHHMTYVTNEVKEYERTLVSNKEGQVELLPW
ncbi:hypothetical protein A8139_17975 [Marinomonas primoryensis]|uniref:Beta protein n=1 Tax=Marinomonas primoryensis TaxID=178399 RepID=A0A2Z4PVX8_9GAMM|nr:beta family protein [Marinomonas primoryensis]AWY01640.1 hypothetical protein A8139_17975 [Marinomonas primoryensis]